MDQEEYGYVIHKLDNKPNIYILGNKKFTPLELSLKKEVNVEVYEKVYFGKDHREKIETVVKWLSENDFLNVSKNVSLETIEKIIFENKDYYLHFINVNILKEEYKNLLQRALCVGPKTLDKIILARKDKPFISFSDLEKRCSTKVIIKSIANKVYDEICGKDKFRIFSNKAKHQ